MTQRPLSARNAPTAARAAARCAATPPLLRACHPPPAVVEFDVTADQALSKFESHQRALCSNFHAGGVLKAAEASGQGLAMTAAYLPFYMFDAEISVECRGTLGFRQKDAPKDAPLSWVPMEEWRQVAARQRVAHTEPVMQVYASFDWRRDLAKAARPTEAMLAAARQLSRDEAESLRVAPGGAPASGGAGEASSSSSGGGRAQGSSGGGDSGGGDSGGGQAGSSSRSGAQGSSNGGGASRTQASSSGSGASGSGQAGAAVAGAVAVQAPEMPLAVAWSLCFRGLKRSKVKECVDALKAGSGAEDVRDLQVNVEVHTRRARLALAPAYHLSYDYGHKYTASRADIVPERHEALLSGRWGGGVSAQPHLSARKGAAAAASTVGVASLAAMQGAEFLGAMEPAANVGMLAVDAGFLAFLAAAAAHVAVKVAPQAARNQHAAAQVKAEREFYRQYDKRESAPNAPPDEHTLWLWFDADWRKWEEEDPWHWDGAARRRWAADLLKQQAARRRERARYLERIERERERQAVEGEREEARRAKFGPSGAYNPWQSAGPGAGVGGGPGAGGGATGGGGYGRGSGAPRRRLDFLGYYRLMGIDPAAGAVDDDAIKAAFKKAALQLHPDRHAGSGDAEAVKKAAGRFQRLQVAYDVLKDPQRRRLYDRGQLAER